MARCPAFLRSILPALLVAPLLGAAAGAATAVQDAAELRRQAAEILAGSRCQTELPEHAGAATDRAPLPFARRLAPTERRATSPSMPLPSMTPPVVVGIVLAVLVALLLLGMMTRSNFVATASGAGSAGAAGRGTLATTTAAALPDAELLAQAGRFADAIHVLLLAALAQLLPRLGGYARGTTSREIVGRVGDPHERAALAELVATVERHAFAEQPLTADDWQRCRAAATALTPAWGA